MLFKISLSKFNFYYYYIIVYQLVFRTPDREIVAFIHNRIRKSKLMQPWWNVAMALNLIWVGRIRKNTQHKHISESCLGDRKQIKTRKYSRRKVEVRERKGGGRVKSYIYEGIVYKANWCVFHPKHLVQQFWEQWRSRKTENFHPFFLFSYCNSYC